MLGEDASDDEGRHYSILRAHHYDWRGKRARSGFGFELPNFPHILADQHGALSVDTDRESNNRQFLKYQNFESKKTVRIDIEDCSRCVFRDAHRSGDNIEVLSTSGGWLDPFRTAYLLEFEPESGAITRQIEIPELAQYDRLKLFETGNGDLIVSGVDYLAGMILRLSSSDRSVKWAKRFWLDKSKTVMHDALELRDGRLAFTGSGAEFSAILMITDAEGKYLDEFGDCFSRGFTFATLRYRLTRELRVNLYANPVHQQATRSRTISPGSRVLPNDQCGDYNEFELVEFAQKILNTPIKIDTSNLPQKTLLTIKADDAENRHNSAFRYMPDNRISSVPIMLVNPAESEKIARELESNVLPFLKEIEEKKEIFYYSSRHTFTNGNTLAQATMQHSGSTQALALNPATYAAAINILEHTLSLLSDTDKKTIKRSVDRMNIVALIPGAGATRRVSPYSIELPERNAGSYWQWILDTNDGYAGRISEAEQTLSDRLNIVFLQSPDAAPHKYLSFLESLFNQLQHLDKSSIPVELEFYDENGTRQSLRIRREGLCTTHSSPGMNAEYIAEWLENIWECGNEIPQ